MIELNKVYQEDCRETMARMPDKCIDLIVTDPPFGMSFKSGHRKVSHKAIANDDNLEWLPSVLFEIKRVLKDNGHAYIFCSNHNLWRFLNQIEECGLPYKNLLIWQKNNTGMGDLLGDYAPQYEMIVYCSNGERKLNGRRDSNILSFPRTQNELHPTQKPVDLIRYLIIKSSEPGEVVYDPFMGSGTTAVASIEEGRSFIGSELEGDYCITANKRIGHSYSQQTLFRA